MPTKTKAVAEKPKAAKTPAKGKAETKVSKEDVKNTKVVAKAAPAAKAPKTKAEPKAKGPYSPQKGTMRAFVFEALKKAPATPDKIIERAAALAKKAGNDKYSETSAYKGFGNMEFYLKVLEENGFTVVRDGKKVGVGS